MNFHKSPMLQKVLELNSKQDCIF